TTLSDLWSVVMPAFRECDGCANAVLKLVGKLLGQHFPLVVGRGVRLLEHVVRARGWRARLNLGPSGVVDHGTHALNVVTLTAEHDHRRSRMHARGCQRRMNSGGGILPAAHLRTRVHPDSDSPVVFPLTGVTH